LDSDLGFGRTKSLALNNPANPAPADIITKGQKLLASPMLSLKLADNIDVRIGGFVRHLVGEFYNESLSKQHLDTSMVLIPGHADSTRVVQSNSDSIRYSESYWRSVSDDGQAEIQATMRLWKVNTFIFGAEYLLNRVHFGETVDRATGVPLLGSQGRIEMISNTGIYAQDEVHLGDISTIVPGLRFDYHSAFGPVLSPKIGGTFSPIDWLHLRMSIGQAFRAPALSELYISDLTLQPGIVLHSNSTLKPERILAFDGGVDISRFKWAKFTVNGFYNLMNDLISPKIQLDTSALGNVNITFRNIASAWSTGAELSFDAAIGEWVSFSANYAYTLTHDDILDTVLDFIPAHKGGMTVSGHADFGKFGIAAQVAEDLVGSRTYINWQGSRNDLTYNAADSNLVPKHEPLSPYLRTDLSLRASYIDKAWLTIGVQNVFDAIYLESGGTLAPGRIFSIKLGGEF
jgi:outer membrane receptor protein involved in Fe transport